MATTFHTLTVADVEPHRRRGRGDLRGARRPGHQFESWPGSVADPAPDGRGSRAAPPYSISAPAGARPRVGVREIPDGLFSRWLSTTYAPAIRSRCRPPPVGSAPTRRSRAAGTCASPPVPASPDAVGRLQRAGERRRRDPGLRQPDDRVGDVSPRNRRPQEPLRPTAQLFQCSAASPATSRCSPAGWTRDRLRRMLTTLVPAARFDHVWLCGPHAMLLDAQEVLAELDVPPTVCTSSFLRRRAAARLHRAEAEVTGETRR